jgi:type II restriction/modification system DNA methylase subunit YeeA
MNLKFLENKFKEEIFKEFITTAFDEFELVDGNYRIDNLTENDREHISEYRYLGETFLDDDSEVGVLILRSATKHIENKRVGFSNVISKLSKPYGKEIILVAIYHDDSPVWRLTFVSYDFKGGKQTQRTDAKRYTYVLGEEIALATAKSRIGMLFNQSSTSQEMIEDIFSVEKVSREFFDKYKKLYFKTLKELQPQVALFRDEKSLDLFTKKLLGRIVFLYFLQKKGWLASDEHWESGDKRFLRNCFDEKYKKYNDFYVEVLQPLFFEALNSDRGKKNDNFEILNCRIPYLNGGLFMRDEFDKNKQIIIENRIFEDIFELFDQYNFTIIESNPNDSEVAIDPEMLGRIFEDLLEDRKDKGAFYTPREIVHYMCQQSIKNYLESRPKEQTELEYIQKIKILDPAIGSGAFPMGMLHEITEMRVNLGDKKEIATIKKEIIENSIYGVDIEPSAVEIAKLRFWLSIVVDEVTPTPLPNLAYKIMVGNSLLQTLNGFDPLVQNQNKKAQKEIRQLQSKFHDYFNESDVKKKEKIDAEVKENINLIFQKTLKYFDIQPRLEMDKKEQKQYENDVENYMFISKIMKEYIKDNYTTELFFYKIYFREVVVDNKGFDVVIGNPPYVRHEKIRELKPKLKAEGYKSYSGTADLYIYFFEQGYNLLKENGVLSYITSNKYTRAKYGKQFREFVLKNATILEYIDFNGVKVFESATVDTSILSYKKSNSKKSSFIYCDINSKYKKESELEKFVAQNGFEYLQSDLSVDSFSFSSSEELAIKKRIEKVGTPLKEWDITINRGITTGFNEAFIIDEKKKNELVLKDKNNIKIIKPLLVGKDIKKYSYSNLNRWIINLHNNPPIDINAYPVIKEHLDLFTLQLQKRQDKGKTFYNLRNCAYLNDFKKDKIIYPEFSSSSSFFYDKKEFYLADTAWMIIAGGKYLIALLNSKLVWFYLQNTVALLGSKSFRMKKTYLNLLPIPKIKKEAQKPFEILVDYIIFAKEENLSLEASLFESVINGMVYDLYFEEEMKKFDCFISDEVVEILEAFDDSLEQVSKMYKIFKESQTVQRGLIYKRVIPIVEIINGDRK